MKTKILNLFVLITAITVMSAIAFNQAHASGGGTIGGGESCPGCTETPPPPPLIENPFNAVRLFTSSSEFCDGEPQTYYYCPNRSGDRESCEEQLLCSQDSCEPELGNPSCSVLLQSNQFFYCGNSGAINGKTQQKCLEDNQAGPGDTCLRNDGLCMYIKINNPAPAITITKTNPSTATPPASPKTPPVANPAPTNPNPSVVTPPPATTIATTPTTTNPPATTTTAPPTTDTNPSTTTTTSPTRSSSNSSKNNANSGISANNASSASDTTNYNSTTTSPTLNESPDNTSSELDNWLESLSEGENITSEDNVCGNGIRETKEVCDDGLDNGKNGFCSPDCLYRNEVFDSANDDTLTSNSINSKNSTSTGKTSESTVAGGINNTDNVISKGVSGIMSVMSTSINKVSKSIQKGRDDIKNIIVANTSPETRQLIRDVAEVATTISKYTVVGTTALMGTLVGALNVMVYRAHWSSYTVQAGDTIDTLGSKFTMTERAMRSKNGLSKGDLQPGTKIKVRNRHLIEKDYLDQLKFVLQDSLEKRNYGKMSAKIDKMFAKK